MRAGGLVEKFFSLSLFPYVSETPVMSQHTGNTVGVEKTGGQNFYWLIKVKVKKKRKYYYYFFYLSLFHARARDIIFPPNPTRRE